MKIYRLIHSSHDPNVIIGTFLTRPSIHSKQKLGEGMYFALSFSDAESFAKKTNDYDYDRILECKITYDLSNFFDLRVTKNPSKMETWLRSKFKAGSIQKMLFNDKIVNYCNAHGHVGLIWESRLGWNELVIFSAHLKNQTVEVKKIHNIASRP